MEAPNRQVDLVSVDYFADTALVKHFNFTLHNGGAMWVYTPIVGMIRGEDESMWTVATWLEDWVDYPVDYDHGRRALHLSRLEAFHADLNEQI